MPTRSTSAASTLTVSRTAQIFAALTALTLAVYGQLCLGEFQFISVDDPDHGPKCHGFVRKIARQLASN